VDEVARGRGHPETRRYRHRLELRLFGKRRIDEALLEHLLKNQIATAARGFGMCDRIVLRLRLRQPGEDGRFPKRQTRGGMSEVVLRGRLDAVPSSTEVDLVEVGFEDLTLGVVPL